MYLIKFQDSHNKKTELLHNIQQTIKPESSLVLEILPIHLHSTFETLAFTLTYTAVMQSNEMEVCEKVHKYYE